MQIRSSIVVGLILALVAAFAPSARAQTWSSADGVILRGTVLTQDASHTVIEGGRVCVKADRIVAVLRPTQAVPAGFERAPVIETNGVILPGLINAHNHIAYNTLELWDAPRLYQNRYQWTSPREYELEINYPKKLLTEPAYFGLSIETCKYAEIKELVGGTTSVQGAPPTGTGFRRMLVRNIDYGLEVDNIYQHALSIDDGRFQAEVLAGGGIVKSLAAGKVAAWIVHAGEGIDEASRAEFQTLKRLNLLREETVIIHGTAFGEAEFREMAAVGADLVWSPLSNRLLYGKTTDVLAARRAGVNVSLASDWSPSGCKNLLGELKIADEIDNNEWGNRLTPRDLVDMVTINPARALKWDNRVGRIAAGYYADLVVVDKRGDPYASVVQAADANVQLVLVGGDPLYGDERHMRLLKGSDSETLGTAGGRRKLVDVTKPAETRGTQSAAEITEILRRALAFTPDRMRTTFRETATMTPAAFDAWLRQKFPGLKPLALDPIFAGGDAHFFDAIRRSVNARFPYDLEGYWTRSTQPVADLAISTGTIGRTILPGQTAPLYNRPQGSVIARVPYGTRVEILEYRLVTSLSSYYRLRTQVSGRTVEGWVYSKNVAVSQ